MEFIKNKLIKEVLKEYYEVFAMTLNTNRFVPVKINKKIVKYIFKNMQAKFRDINIYYLLTLKYNGIRLGIISRIRIWLSGLEPVFNFEMNKIEEKQKLKEEKKKELELKKIKRKKYKKNESLSLPTIA